MRRITFAALRTALACALCLPQFALASEFDGRQLSAIWALPFVGILLSIALLPLCMPHLWHHHFGKIAAAWALAFLMPFGVTFGASQAAASAVHVLLGEYLPFVILLTALPPLFLGFLQGVDFLWTARHLLPMTLFLVGTLPAIFYVLDAWYYHRREELLPRDPTPDARAIGFDGSRNFWLLGLIVLLVLVSGAWKPGVTFRIAGVDIGLPGLVRDLGLIGVTLLSLRYTAQSVRAANQFSWGPMQEVAKLFAGIFLTILPVIAMLRVGTDGPFGPLVAAVTRPDGSPDPAMYFWAAGALSSFLDNAPTYLVFFNTAGGDAKVLMTSMASTLTAISAGAVFMGANTHIGNAPNMMVKAIAEERGVAMPGFFGYMAWSAVVLLPLFGLLSLFWFS